MLFKIFIWSTIQFLHGYESIRNVTNLRDKLEACVRNALDLNGNQLSDQERIAIDQERIAIYLEQKRRQRHEIDIAVEKRKLRMKELQKEEDEIDEMIKKLRNSRKEKDRIDRK